MSDLPAEAVEAAARAHWESGSALPWDGIGTYMQTFYRARTTLMLRAALPLLEIGADTTTDPACTNDSLIATSAVLAAEPTEYQPCKVNSGPENVLCGLRAGHGGWHKGSRGTLVLSWKPDLAEPTKDRIEETGGDS